MTRFRLACTLLFGMLLALCTTAYAQKITSTLTGTVVDSTNAVVSDAAITVTNQATGTSRSTKTNPEGQYSVPELDPGVYSVKVNKAGFKEIVQKNLELHVGDTRELRTELPPAHAVPLTEPVGQLLDAGLHALLLESLGQRVELTVGDDLGGNG